MAKFKKVVTLDPEGWSDWQAPIMNGYKMGCCDCGLVHDMEFEVGIAVYDPNDPEAFELEPIKNGRVLMRARRNNRSTGQMRRRDRDPGE